MFKITLAAARVNAGLSQKQAAELLGVSNKTLCKWEIGTAFPTTEKVALICEVYGCPIDVLIFLPDNSL